MTEIHFDHSVDEGHAHISQLLAQFSSTESPQYVTPTPYTLNTPLRSIS
jgi:hypothetical protein